MIEINGKVEQVHFYESNVGTPNKSIVVVLVDSRLPKTVAIEGDVRNALPVGSRVRMKIRKDGDVNVLAHVEYY